MYKGLRLVTCVAHIVLMDKGVCMPESNKQQVHRILKYSIPSGFIYDSESQRRSVARLPDIFNQSN